MNIYYSVGAADVRRRSLSSSCMGGEEEGATRAGQLSAAPARMNE